MTASRGPRTGTAVLERALLDALDGAEELSRVELTEITGLSRTVVAALVGGLVERGEIAPVAHRPRPGAGRGRPSTVYRLNRSAPLVALVHLRRTRSVVTLATSAGSVAEHTIGVPWPGPWEKWAEEALDVLEAAERAHGRAARRVVIAVPFTVDSAHGDRLMPLAGPAPATPPGLPPYGPQPDPAFRDALVQWHGDEPGPRLARLFRRPVHFANAANLAALGEAHYGAARGAAVAIHLSVCHGIGAGLVLGGELFTGASGTAGELAHVQVTEDGPYCPCGSRGCLAVQAPGPDPHTALERRYGRRLEPAEVDALVTDGHPVAVRFFHDFGRLTARSLAGTVTLLNPDTIVLDADLRCAARPFGEGLSSALALHCPPSYTRDLRVVPGELHDALALGAVATGQARDHARHRR
ncbi:ROK family transcriptional regulator [Streptomyces mangrovisoli]|uniref:ROK family protein n=1 Tax=Streptomyces mangrovisoli TaxID=1428628 RepID=A0A1J4NSB3_9ACTN|nr:ROK family transcriptional regulator [Streptomyces mangrovisoli]OIJ65002.1 hypothetical protein WN71_025710 [Streptomyces mangrovisoli]